METDFYLLYYPIIVRASYLQNKESLPCHLLLRTYHYVVSSTSRAGAFHYYLSCVL